MRRKKYKSRLSLAAKVLTGFLACSILIQNPKYLNAKTKNENPSLEQVVIKKVIFLPFYNKDENADYQWIETSITLWLDGAAKKKYRYIKIPESAWREYMKKNNLTNAALFDQEKLSQMGKALGADGIVYGRFWQDKESKKMIIDGRILSVIDRSVLANKRVDAPLDFNIFDATEELGLYLSDRIKDLFLPTDEGALWRSAVAPGWGFFYKQKKSWGYVHASLTGTAFLLAVIGNINFIIKKNEYTDYNPEHVTTPSGETALYDPDGAAAKFNELESDAVKAGKFAKTATYAFLIFYAANLVHSYFIEPDAGNISVAYLEPNSDSESVSFALMPGFIERDVRFLRGPTAFRAGSLDGFHFSVRYSY